MESLIEAAEIEQHAKTIVFTMHFGDTSLQKSLKIVAKLKRTSYHPKIPRSCVFGHDFNQKGYQNDLQNRNKTGTKNSQKKIEKKLE